MKETSFPFAAVEIEARNSAYVALLTVSKKPRCLWLSSVFRICLSKV